MTPFELSVPFTLGLLSSLHCGQMCGPIVLGYSMGGRSSNLGHLCYNAGRIGTYTILGAVAGAGGQALGLAGRMAGIQQTAALVSGVLMLLAGVLLIGALPRQGLIGLGRAGFPDRFRSVIARLLLARGAARKLALGAMMGFLPCGLLYAALLQAASTGSIAKAALSMAAFGAGTSGMLLAIGLFASTINLRLGRWSNVLASAGVMLTGAVLVLRGVLAGMPGGHHHAGM